MNLSPGKLNLEDVTETENRRFRFTDGISNGFENSKLICLTKIFQDVCLPRVLRIDIANHQTVIA